jgi:hypothetical protein
MLTTLLPFETGLFLKLMSSWLIMFEMAVASLLMMFILILLWTWKLYQTMFRKWL